MASQKFQKTNGYLSSLAKYTLAFMVFTLILTLRFTSVQTAGTLDPTFGTGRRVTPFFGGDGLNGDEGHSVVPCRTNWPCGTGRRSNQLNYAPA